jgi:hypothetical protein
MCSVHGIGLVSESARPTHSYLCLRSYHICDVFSGNKTDHISSAQALFLFQNLNFIEFCRMQDLDDKVRVRIWAEKASNRTKRSLIVAVLTHRQRSFGCGTTKIYGHILYPSRSNFRDSIFERDWWIDFSGFNIKTKPTGLGL